MGQRPTPVQWARPLGVVTWWVLIMWVWIPNNKINVDKQSEGKIVSWCIRVGSGRMAFPEARYGPVSCVDEERELFHVMWGSTAGQNRRGIGEYKFDCLWSFDHVSRAWKKSEWQPDGEGDGPEEEEGRLSPPVEVGACCTMMNGKMYSFGGWMMGNCSASVHELDLETMIWRCLEPTSNKNLPLLKNKCGMVDYGSEMLFVFGGYGYPQLGMPLQPGARYEVERDDDLLGWPVYGWTNEMHLFHVKKRVWVVPQTTGTRPPPCAAFSFTKIDCHRVVLFGGRQLQARVNEIHILDMSDWHWSSAITATSPLDPWPVGRSFHTACCLVDPAYVPLPESKDVPKHFDWLPCDPPELGLPLPSSNIKEQRLLVLWGMDQNAEPIGDAWILQLSSFTWEKLSLPANLVARVWFSSGVFHPTPAEAIVVSFGGTTTNLFKANSIGTEETVMLQFGVPTLTQLCQHWLVSHLRDLIPLHSLLPAHVLQRLLELKARQSRLQAYHYQTHTHS